MTNPFNQKDYPVVLFDSQCLICNGFVRWIIKMDKNQLIKFSGLQSDKAQLEIATRNIPMPENDSVVLLFPNSYFLESNAIIEILKMTRRSSILANLISRIPQKWRDALYHWVARNRYRFYKKRNYCPMPDSSEAGRFV